MQKLELSDIYPSAFLICNNFYYEIKSEVSPNGKKRVIFLFNDDKKAKDLVKNFYSGQNDNVSASKYSRILKELKSLVHNY